MNTILKQVESLIQGAATPTGNLCNVLSFIKEEMGLFWIGIYVLDGGKLKLSSFQGLAACTDIELGNGVCGKAMQDGVTYVVEDVRNFDGYIACHAEAMSEIVVPHQEAEGSVSFVLDVDSEHVDFFSAEHKQFFEKLVELIAPLVRM